MKYLSLILVFLSAWSCSTSINEYSKEKPALVFEKFFDGKLVAHGYFKDRNNLVSKRFVVAMQASWKNNVGILDEDFTYSDGSKSRRIWTLTKISDNKFEGTASDVIGIAEGIVVGNTLLWKYVLNLKVDDKYYEVNFEDWMYLIDESTIMNQSYMSKYKINLGEVVLSIQKVK